MIVFNQRPFLLMVDDNKSLGLVRCPVNNGKENGNWKFLY